MYIIFYLFAYQHAQLNKFLKKFYSKFVKFFQNIKMTDAAARIFSLTNFSDNFSILNFLGFSHSKTYQVVCIFKNKIQTN